jgi:hypothetical protein
MTILFILYRFLKYGPYLKCFTGRNVDDNSRWKRATRSPPHCTAIWPAHGGAQRYAPYQRRLNSQIYFCFFICAFVFKDLHALV